MRCETFESRMHSLLDNRQRPEVDSQLQAHAMGCADCQRRLDVQENLFAGLELFQAPAPKDVSAQVIKNVAANDRRRYGTWALLAAALLIALGIVPFAVNRIAPIPDPGSFVYQQPTNSAERMAPNSNFQREATAEDYLETFASALPVGQLPESLEDIDSLGLAKGLRPLASSFTSVYGLLRRTIPVGRDSRSSTPQAELRSISNFNA